MAPLTLLAATESGRHLHWPWVMVALGVLVLALLVWWVRDWRHRTPRTAAYVAHATRLAALPRFRALVRRRVALGAALTLTALIAATGSIVLAGRVQVTRTTNQDESSRDIMLCLDSSGSMITIDRDVLAQFQEIVDGLHGDRVGLTIWSGTAVTVFPLTDDYAYITDQLTQAQTAFASGDVFSDAYQKFTEGTLINDHSASQAGDGLASCVQRFDRSDENRSRAIVLATDNEPYGKGVFTLGQAAAYAKEHHVVVHGICAPTTASRPAALAEYKSAVIATGGTFSLLGQDGSVGTVVSSIEALEAKRIKKPPLIQTVDDPHLGTVIAGVGVGLLVVVWLLQGLFFLLDRDPA
ncbi:MAG TPA: VWA domain-containing protein [Nocardioides sp.]|nr:VWA domain-containing protein [Nocardioides sp.]